MACHPNGKAEQQSEKTTESASAKAAAAPKPVASSVVWPPAAPPGAPPQFVACGERDFYRINQHSLQVFEIAPVTPPPQIRGSRVARQTTEVEIAAPLNVISLAKKRALVIAKNNLFRYELGETRATRYQALSVPRPVVAWPDPRRDDSFWVHTQGARSVQQYTLASVAKSAAKATKQPAEAEPVTAGPVQQLTDFDARLFTVESDGTPLYSTAHGLRQLGDASPVPFPVLSKPASLLFADTTPKRFWTADASGALALWDRKRVESPVFSSHVPGVVIDVAIEGQTLAVLSTELVAGSYRSTLTIFSKGERKGQLSIAPSVAARGQPKLDVCLLAGSSWAVVGTRRWLQLLDWSSRRLLAEW